jgi:probable phosphoglycerate mutase
MKRFWAMRHGETEWNALGLLQGHADAPLTARGVAAAEAAARLLATERIERVVSSDLGRARQTAAIVARLLRIPTATDPDWRELDVGRLAGTRSADISLTPGYSRSPDWRLPGGESLIDVRARVARALGRLDQPGTPSVLVVTHAGPLRVLVAAATGLSPERMLEVAVARETIGVFDLDQGVVRSCSFETLYFQT